MSLIKIPDILRQKLTESGTDALIGVLNQVEQSSRENAIGIVAERFERRLSDEMAKLRSEDLANIRSEIGSLRTLISDHEGSLRTLISEREVSMHTLISNSEVSLRTLISDREATLRALISGSEATLRALILDREVRTIRWMVALWISQMTVTVGLFLKLRS